MPGPLHAAATIHHDSPENGLVSPALGALCRSIVDPMNSALASRHFDKTPTFWAEHREASLNWLALGLLLAAWNVTNDPESNSETRALRRPDPLQPYSCVSVRAAQRFVCTSHKSVNTL